MYKRLGVVVDDAATEAATADVATVVRDVHLTPAWRTISKVLSWPHFDANVTRALGGTFGLQRPPAATVAQGDQLGTKGRAAAWRRGGGKHGSHQRRQSQRAQSHSLSRSQRAQVQSQSPSKSSSQQNLSRSCISGSRNGQSGTALYLFQRKSYGIKFTVVLSSLQTRVN